jgi:putative endonuclease
MTCGSGLLGEGLETIAGPSTPQVQNTHPLRSGSQVFLGERAAQKRVASRNGGVDWRVHERGYFVYIMASRSHTLYIGVTGDLHKRVFEHKWREHDGFTAKYNCDRLVWYESYQDVGKAIAREKQLKGWRREKKIVLIEKMNPAWVDLSRDWYDLEPADFRRAMDRMNA